MSAIKDSESQNTQTQLANLSLQDMKALFYLMNAKPDSSIQLLEARKMIAYSDIIDLNDAIQKKLENYDVNGLIVSVNLMFGKGHIKEYNDWEQFKIENRKVMNRRTESLSITWDFAIKLIRYENPQRHTLKFKVGQSISPKDMMDLVFSSDNPTELREKSAAGVVKVDFINEVMANELIGIIVNWYECLKPVVKDKGIQKFIEKKHKFLVMSIARFIPILVMMISYAFIELFWHLHLVNLTLNVLIITLIIFAFFYLLGTTISNTFARSIDRLINSYKGECQFNITKGDENAIHATQSENKSITRLLIYKAILLIVTPAFAFFVRHILEILLPKMK